MRLGNLNSTILLILISLYFPPLFAETQVDLQNIQPTFEEEPEILDDNKNEQVNYIKTKKKEKIQTNKTIVSLTRIEPPLHPDGPEKMLMDFGVEPEEFKEEELLDWFN